MISEPNGDVHSYPITKVSELKEGVYIPIPDIYGLDREKANENTRLQASFASQTGKDEPGKNTDISLRLT